MKALVGAFNQEKALVGAFSVIVQPVVEPMEHFTALVKIFTWRANGDGINPFRGTLVEDCFIRTQDDSTYVTGAGIRRVVYWQDANGSTFVLSPLGSEVRVPNFDINVY